MEIVNKNEELSEEDAKLSKERERLRKERRERSAKSLEKRKKERRRNLFLVCGGLAVLVLCFFMLGRFIFGRKSAMPDQREAISSETLQLTVIKNLSEEEKAELESYAKEDGGMEIHFLSPEMGEGELKSAIQSFKTDIVLGGEEENAAFLSELSEGEKIPYLATTYISKDSLREYTFCLSKSAEEQAVDLAFFAYNEAFRSMGILSPEGKADLLSTEITEAFQELGGTATVYNYSSEEDFRTKISELENAGIDILFLENYSQEGMNFLAEEHNFTVLLGEDWDRGDFPGNAEIKTNCLLYAKNTKTENLDLTADTIETEDDIAEGDSENLVSSETEVSDSATAETESTVNSEVETTPETETIAETQADISEAEESETATSDESVLSILEEENDGREKAAMAILKMALQNKGKSLFEKLSGLLYQGTSGIYELKNGDYALKGQAVFYEIIEKKRVEIS